MAKRKPSQNKTKASLIKLPHIRIEKLQRKIESERRRIAILVLAYESLSRERDQIKLDRDQLQRLINEKNLAKEKQDLLRSQLNRDLDHVLRQRSHLESELINNCGAVRVEYGDDDKPARVLWPVDPVTGVGTHKANAKYAAEVQARAVKAEADRKKLSDVIAKLAQAIEAISGC